MPIVFGDTASLRARVRSSITSSSGDRTCSSWSSLLTGMEQGPVILAIPSITSMTVQRIRFLRKRSPECPIILVTGTRLENTRRLVEVPVDEVVWLEEVDSELESSIRRARRARRLSRVREDLLEISAFSAPEMITAAFDRTPPFGSVGEWARACSVSRSWLYRNWSGSPKEFLDWILLLRAVEAKSGSTWSDTVSKLRTTRSRLYRLCLRLTGESLSMVVRAGWESVVERFEAWSRENLEDEFRSTRSSR